MANCNNHPSHLLPSAFHGSHSPSSGTGQSQDLSCTRFPCSLPELHISFVFDTLRFSVCIHIYSGSFTLPINLKTLTYSLLQPAPKSLVAHHVLRALWLYRCPTISFVFDTLRFILQFQVCSSFSPGSAPVSYKFALLCVSKSLICRLSTSFNEFFPAFYTEKKQGDYYRLDHYSSRSFDIFVGSDRYTSPNMETIRLPVPSNHPLPQNPLPTELCNRYWADDRYPYLMFIFERERTLYGPLMGRFSTFSLTSLQHDHHGWHLPRATAKDWKTFERLLRQMEEHLHCFLTKTFPLTNQPQDSYIFSFAACPKIPGRPPCPSCSLALSSSHHLFCI